MYGAAHNDPNRLQLGENFFVDGLSQGELCIGDLFAVEGSSVVLEVASPRRPCDKWNKVHSEEHSSQFHGEIERNVYARPSLTAVAFLRAHVYEICSRVAPD